MLDYQSDFFRFSIDNDVLKFGSFTLKSGRTSPYFFNAGLFNSGHALNRLSEFYARTLNQHVPGPCMLFGPAYKGIPLVTGVAMAMDSLFQRDIPMAYNRKEAKDHGEGGVLVGAPLEGDVIIVDDVITAGTSVGESVEIIRAAGANPAGVLIALDREEVVAGSKGRSAVQVVKAKYGMPVYSVAKLTTLIEYLGSLSGKDDLLRQMQGYREQYGARA